MATGVDPYDGRTKLAVAIVCPECHQKGAVVIAPGQRGIECPRCRRLGVRLDPDTWLARQIIALAMDALGTTHGEKPEPRTTFDSEQAEAVRLHWYCKEIQMWVGDKVEVQSPGLVEILEALAEWVEEYLAGRTDTWPHVTLDCTDSGLTTILPSEYAGKLRELRAPEGERTL